MAVPDATAALARAGAAEVYALARDGRRAGPQVIPFTALSDDARRMTMVAPGELAAALTLGDAAPAHRRGGCRRDARGRNGWRPASLTSWPPWSRSYLRPPRGLAEMTEGAVTWL